jgi:minor histocompatibility antigen H13
MECLEMVALSLRTPSFFLLPFGAFPSVLYTFSTESRKSALLTDILSLSFSHNALSLLKIDSFQTGCILLSGLFLYDIWWVFGTEVVGNASFLIIFTDPDIDGHSRDIA